MNCSLSNIYDWENSEIQNFFRNHDWVGCDESDKAKWLRAVSNGIIMSATVTHTVNSDSCEMMFIKEIPACIYKANKVITISGLNDFLAQFDN